MKARLLLIAAFAALTALVAAGCGSSSDADSGSDPAALAPPTSPLYIEATLQPEGELKTNVNDLARTIAGVDDLGELIVEELESSAGEDGEELDFEKEIAPWLGERAGMSFQKYDGEDFRGYGIAVQTTDPDAAQAFVEDQSANSDEPVEDGSYEGVDFKVQGDDGTTVGVIGDYLAFAEEEVDFKQMVDASEGDSLADADDFSETFDAAADGSLADVFVDVGALVNQSGGTIDPEAKQFFDSAGIDPNEATAVASLLPGSDQIEIDVSSDFGGENPPGGDATELLGSLPADSAAAVAVPGFGERLGEALDEIDANGIPGEIPPKQFKSTLKQAGIDVDKISGSIGNLGVFATGNSERSLAGAAVLEMKDAEEARNTVANVGLLLRAAETPGVTALSGKFSGFSVRSDDLGPKPLVVAAAGEKIAIAYGLPAATQVLTAGSGQTLADTPLYKEAVSALDGTTISGFADGPAALRIASALFAGSDDEEDFREAEPYLEKIDYLAIGSGADDGLASIKLIAGVGE